MSDKDDQQTDELSVSIGDIVLAFKGQKLTISNRNDPSQMLETNLDAGGIERLASFLHSLPKLQDERRLAFRVPVRADYGLALAICEDNNELDVEAIDISYTGVLISVPPDSPLDLSMNDDLVVRVAFEGREIKLRGQVRRILPDQFGIFFVDSIRDGEIEPPQELAEVVMELQRRWLNSVKHRR